MFNIVRLSKFVVKFTYLLNYDVQTQIHCYFNKSFFFFSVVAGGTSHFYSFFPINTLARAEILV